MTRTGIPALHVRRWGPSDSRAATPTVRGSSTSTTGTTTQRRDSSSLSTPTSQARASHTASPMTTPSMQVIRVDNLKQGQTGKSASVKHATGHIKTLRLHRNYPHSWQSNLRMVSKRLVCGTSQRPLLIHHARQVQRRRALDRLQV